MPEIEQTLEELGLTRNEARVYLALLRHGSLTASEITEKTRIHRMNVYSIISKLQGRGLISYIIIGKRKYYEAFPPKKLLELLEEKKKKLQEILPEINSQINIGKHEQEATIFKDKKGVRHILEEMENSKTDICLFASGWGMRKYFPEYYDIWHAHLKLNKVKIRAMVSKKFKGKIKIPEPINCKFLSSPSILPSATYVYEDKVFIAMWSEQPLGILMRSKQISDSYREYFNLLWKSARK